MNGSMYNNSSNNSNENENDEKSGQNWSQHDAFAAFDESPFGGGAPTKPPESPQVFYLEIVLASFTTFCYFLSWNVFNCFTQLT